MRAAAPGVFMLIALVLFAVFGGPVGRALKPTLAIPRVPGWVECPTGCVEPEAMVP